ncbi:unnamed protein product [Larinioides sclopetarius]|uniref:Uncharacterized protein n=1 Tax=Larinioides sclopetarius TaxID=280406 RepID=A0AAV1ZDM6_9ARAC
MLREFLFQSQMSFKYPMTLQVALQAFKMGLSQIFSIFVDFCIQSTKMKESQLPLGLPRLTLQADGSPKGVIVVCVPATVIN